MKQRLLRHIALCVTVLTLIGHSARAQTRIYAISAADSSLWVFVGKAGLFSALAHDHEIGVKSFTGRVTVAADASSGQLALEIDARSLVVLDKKVSEEDRTKIYNSMHGEVLASTQHQKITFKAVAVTEAKPTSAQGYGLMLTGALTLHGVTRRIAVPVNVTITAQHLRATGKYTLKQTDYGIKPYSAAGGTVRVKNEIVINFDIVAKAA